MKIDIGTYVWKAFAPLIILWIPIIAIFGAGGIINLLIGGLSVAFLGLFVAFFPVPLLGFAYFVDQKVQNLRARGLIVYCVFLVAIFVASFFFSAAIGGTSMAAVENPDRWLERQMLYLSNSLWTVLLAQPIILLCTLVGYKRLKKLSLMRQQPDFL